MSLRGEDDDVASDPSQPVAPSGGFFSLRAFLGRSVESNNAYAAAPTQDVAHSEGPRALIPMGHDRTRASRSPMAPTTHLASTVPTLSSLAMESTALPTIPPPSLDVPGYASGHGVGSSCATASFANSPAGCTTRRGATPTQPAPKNRASFKLAISPMQGSADAMAANDQRVRRAVESEVVSDGTLSASTDTFDPSMMASAAAVGAFGGGGGGGAIGRVNLSSLDRKPLSHPPSGSLNLGSTLSQTTYSAASHERGMVLEPPSFVRKGLSRVGANAYTAAAEVAMLNDDLRQSKTRADELEAQLTDQARATTQLQARLREREGVLSTMSQELAAHSASSERMRGELEHASFALQQQRDAHVVADRAAAEAAAEAAALRQRVAELENDHGAAMSKLRDLERDAERREGETRTQASHLTQVRQALESERRRTDELHSGLTAQSTRYEQLQKEHAQLRVDARKLEDEVQARASAVDIDRDDHECDEGCLHKTAALNEAHSWTMCTALRDIAATHRVIDWAAQSRSDGTSMQAQSAIAHHPMRRAWSNDCAFDVAGNGLTTLSQADLDACLHEPVGDAPASVDADVAGASSAAFLNRQFIQSVTMDVAQRIKNDSVEHATTQQIAVGS